MATKKQKIEKLYNEVGEFFKESIYNRFLENGNKRDELTILENDNLEEFVKQMNKFKNNVVLHYESVLDEIDYNNHDEEVYIMMEKINDFLYGE